MMTALVACLWSAPSRAFHRHRLRHAQKPFAIGVIVAGLISRLFLGFFCLNPVLYEIVARDGDVLQV